MRNAPVQGRAHIGFGALNCAKCFLVEGVGTPTLTASSEDEPVTGAALRSVWPLAPRDAGSRRVPPEEPVEPVAPLSLVNEFDRIHARSHVGLRAFPVNCQLTHGSNDGCAFGELV